MAAIAGVGIGLVNTIPGGYANELQSSGIGRGIADPLSDLTFVPNRAASWWCTIEDLQWSQKKITDKIKRRA